MRSYPILIRGVYDEVMLETNNSGPVQIDLETWERTSLLRLFNEFTALRHPRRWTHRRSWYDLGNHQVVRVFQEWLFKNNEGRRLVQKSIAGGLLQTIFE